MKIRACPRCGSRKLALMELPTERESHPTSELIDNVIAVRYLCGDCSLIEEAVVFASEEEWLSFQENRKRYLRI
ncbi:MAG: hypothetical protein B6U97_00930 [Candidatus Altiarchaeales archaeon ex4484_96]|nr:MAG: hypothetical protein B6U97_00930 [Candidatus Altiarchaeales archaeon ex4484_96]